MLALARGHGRVRVRASRTRILGKEEMNSRFTLPVFASGRYVAELESRALAVAAAQTGWTGPMQIHGTYKIVQTSVDAWSWTDHVKAARERGDKIWATVTVEAYDAPARDFKYQMNFGYTEPVAREDSKFRMWAFGSGHTADEVEASALTRASAISGWQGPLRITRQYELQQMPDHEIVKGAYADHELMNAAHKRGDTMWASIQVEAYDEPAGIDLNVVLAEGLRAMDDWDDAPGLSEDEQIAGHALVGVLATLHATLRDGGTPPEAWRKSFVRADHPWDLPNGVIDDAIRAVDIAPPGDNKGKLLMLYALVKAARAVQARP